LTFKLVQARDQTRLRCVDANPFSCCLDISYTNKKPQIDGTRNSTFRCSLHAIIKSMRRPAVGGAVRGSSKCPVLLCMLQGTQPMCSGITLSSLFTARFCSYDIMSLAMGRNVSCRL